MRRGRPPHPELLTPREQEVLALIREGLTNEQIAGRLGISESGARYHVSEILSKLGVESRREAAQWKSSPSSKRFGSLVPALTPAVLVTAAVGVVVLTVAMVWRTDFAGGDEPGSAGMPLPPDASEEGLGALLGLAGEAEREARRVIPSAELYAIAYPETSGLYTFRFHEPGGLREVGIVGPYSNDPSFPVWERYEDVRPGDSPEPEPLIVANLEHDLGAIMGAVRERRSYAGELSIVVWVESGDVHWLVTPAVRTSNVAPFQCRSLMESDVLASMTCEEPAPIR